MHHAHLCTHLLTRLSACNQRKPYTVGNKTVFLSDEELEVFKMTMGKEQVLRKALQPARVRI